MAAKSPMPIKDYTLLAQQPLSTGSLADSARDAIVISAIVDERGEHHVLSRFGDLVWEMWPFFTQSNVESAAKRLNWSRIPEQFRGAVKAVLYRYWVAGIPDYAPPSASTLRTSFEALLPFFRYLDDRNIVSLSQVQAIHVHNFLQDRLKMGLSPAVVYRNCMLIGNLYRLRGEHPDGLMFDPWPEDSLRSGPTIPSQYARGDAAKTPLIPPEIVRTLFAFAENVIEGADVLIDERNAGRRNAHDPEVLRIRNASFFVLGLLTGMRCDEIVGIEVNAARTEVKDGITYHWLRSVEHKTKKGPVEYLVPSMGLRVLSIMERWSEPLRVRLSKQLGEWEAEEDPRKDSKHLETIASARLTVNRLFLGMPRRNGHSVAISASGLNKLLKKFAYAAGVKWPLASHQLRRSYAWTFVRHRLGNMLFLKEQFKHSSLEMTQLYAANPNQDPALYDEFLSELRNLKVEVIQHWLSDDIKLSGGAGRKIVAMRANTYANRKELIEDTAETMHIRSNGHAWCLAQDDGCGGAGLYERTRCANCNNGCIDDSHAPIWKEIYANQLELVQDAQDLGPGAQQRVERDRKRALQVLTELGLAPEDQK
jgi:site-specific recombinase XerD